MGEDLSFTEAEVARLEALYRTADAAGRRRAVREALALDAGESVLSVGCGPGFEPAELAPAVGSSGNVVGVDRSEAMLAAARERCADRPQVRIERGDATSLPVDDGAFDAVVSVQVLEYVADVERAVEELRRVLAPGGRAVVYATDWDSLVWRSSDRERMARVLDAWADHCTWPHLGSRLGPTLREADLPVDSVEPYTVLDTRLDDDAFATYQVDVVAEYVAEHADVGPEVAETWADDLRERDEAGETFFSLTAFLYLVHKPA